MTALCIHACNHIPEDTHREYTSPESGSSVFYAETNSYPPEECVLSDISSVDEFTANESILHSPTIQSQEYDMSQPQLCFTPDTYVMPKLVIPEITHTKPELAEITPTSSDAYSDKIELDYKLPLETSPNFSPPDLVCEICQALPPAGTKLNICIKCNTMFCGVCESLPSPCEHVMVGTCENKSAEKTPKPKSAPMSWPVSRRRCERKKRPQDVQPLDFLMIQSGTEELDLEQSTVHPRLNNSNDPLIKDLLEIDKTLRQLSRTYKK